MVCVLPSQKCKSLRWSGSHITTPHQPSNRCVLYPDFNLSFGSSSIRSCAAHVHLVKTRTNKKKRKRELYNRVVLKMHPNTRPKKPRGWRKPPSRLWLILLDRGKRKITSNTEEERERDRDSMQSACDEERFLSPRDPCQRRPGVEKRW